MWPTVRSAVEWALELRTARGEVRWERDAVGLPGTYALLSGCASIHQSLRCAVALAKLADDPRPDWELAADQLGHLVARHPEAFADKGRFAMDWYYPVLGGAVRGVEADRRVASAWDTFVAHVHAADFPETVSAWHDLGREAGFGTVREVFVAPSDLLRMYRFGA